MLLCVISVRFYHEYLQYSGTFRVIFNVVWTIRGAPGFLKSGGFAPRPRTPQGTCRLGFECARGGRPVPIRGRCPPNRPGHTPGAHPTLQNYGKRNIFGRLQSRGRPPARGGRRVPLCGRRASRGSRRARQDFTPLVQFVAQMELEIMNDIHVQLQNNGQSFTLLGQRVRKFGPRGRTELPRRVWTALGPAHSWCDSEKVRNRQSLARTDQFSDAEKVHGQSPTHSHGENHGNAAHFGLAASGG